MGDGTAVFVGTVVGVSVGGTGVFVVVGGIAVAVGGIGVLVGTSVGGTGVSVGGMAVAVGGQVGHGGHGCVPLSGHPKVMNTTVQLNRNVRNRFMGITLHKCMIHFRRAVVNTRAKDQSRNQSKSARLCCADPRRQRSSIVGP